MESSLKGEALNVGVSCGMRTIGKDRRRDSEKVRRLQQLTFAFRVQ